MRDCAPVLSLVDWPIGRPAVLVAVDGDPAFARRVSQLGLRPDTVLTPVLQTVGGGRVVAAGALRLALDHASAAMLRVEETSPPAEADPSSDAGTMRPT
ncbi:MAG TPA: ferrous iron transport protein A [Candidatus Lustribacter sp.]|nr:ferrous iron transport protein A [Candidatus Lustribacter sp.]